MIISKKNSLKRSLLNPVMLLEQSMTAMGIPWALESVQYEDDTGFIHLEWTWEATDDGDDTV